MARDYNGQLTLPAATATSLLDLLVGAGFRSTPLALEYTIKEAAADIYRGNSNAVNASNGELIAAGGADTQRGSRSSAIDLSQVWLFSTPGTAFSISVRGLR